MQSHDNHHNHLHTLQDHRHIDYVLGSLTTIYWSPCCYCTYRYSHSMAHVIHRPLCTLRDCPHT